MIQLTPEQAVAVHDSDIWRDWDAKTLAHFQAQQQYLCVPFSRFHQAVEEVLGRPVWTHEFGLNMEGIRAEIIGLGPAPSFTEIVALLPDYKRVAVISLDAAGESVAVISFDAAGNSNQS